MRFAGGGLRFGTVGHQDKGFLDGAISGSPGMRLGEAGCVATKTDES
jgi:hypothetical protein